jgi:ankyrin repeat protein
MNIFDIDIDTSSPSFLLNAARNGDIVALTTYLNDGIDINSQNNRKETALHVSSCKGFDEISRLLLDRGAVVNIKNENGETALILAIKNSHENIVQLLLDAGANISSKDEMG